MNKSDLIQQIANNYRDVPKDDIEQAVLQLIEMIAQRLEQGGRCEIRGFGSFSVKKRNARPARNPKTGEPVTIPEKHVVHFKPGRPLKEQVNASASVVTLL